MFKKLLLTSALLTTFVSAHAQQTASFGVQGSVIPSPCTVTMVGGNINLGSPTLTAVKGFGVLNGLAYQYAALNATISVVCTANTKVALAFVDNKANKAVSIDFNDVGRFSLTDGAAGTASIGAYQAAFISTSADFGTTTTADVAAVGQFLNAANATTTWSTGYTSPLTLAPGNIVPGRSVAFAKLSGTPLPDGILKFDGTLQFRAFLGKSVVDAASTTLTPNGSGTITLVYL